MNLPLWRRSRRERELDEEIRSHFSMAERENMESQQTSGHSRLSHDKRFGNVGLIKETTRDMWGARWIADLLQDIRFALRVLAKNPGFTAVAVLTLALGIGANTAIFSLVDTVMLKMLPVQNPEELILIGMGSPESTGKPSTYFTNSLCEQIRDHQDVFSGVLTWGPEQFDLAQGGESQKVRGLYVSGGYFDVLGVRPLAGRLFTTNDDKRGCTGTAVISYGFWRGRYGSSPTAIGSIINLDSHPFQIIGITPPSFFGLTVGSNFDVAVPICAEAIIHGKNSMLDQGSAWWLRVVGRPKPGITTDQISARLRLISPGIFAAAVPQNLKASFQKNFLRSVLVATPAAKGVSGLRKAYDEPLKMLMTIVGLLLLIACANIATLMLSRAASRRKEISIRLAVGASRSRLIRQLLTECMLLSSAGAMLGVFFARWGSALLTRFISTTRNPVFLELSLNTRILGFTACVAVFTGLLFGVLPAFRSTRVSLATAMKGVQTNDNGGRARLQPGRWIVASQVALSLVLVIVAGLFLESFVKLLTLDPGFDRSNVLIISADVHNAGIPPGSRVGLYAQILDRLKSLPGVTSASESILTPLEGGAWNNIFELERGGGPAGNDALANMNYVSPEYFATLHSPILAGRGFDERDSASAPLVAIVNETMARKFFLDSEPIGRYIHVDPPPGLAAPLMQIVGVLKDAKYNSLREATIPTVYFPFAQLASQPGSVMTETPEFELRTLAPPSALSQPAAGVITGFNRSISVEFRTLQEQVDESLHQDQLLATLSGFFGGLALLLAMIGLYGVVAYMVTQRRKELGIRMALGAGKSSILRLVLRDVSVLMVVGIAAGVGISLWATRLMQKMLFDLTARDTKTILGAVSLLAGVAIIAAILPARRAANIDPNTVLRDE